MAIQKLTRRAVTLVVVLAWITIAALPAQAQGCAMCYTSAQAQGESGQRAINKGIFFLLSPTLLLFGGLLLVAYKRRE